MNHVTLHLTVITTAEGALVGTFPAGLQREDSGGRPMARVVAGLGQRLQELDVDVPQELLDAFDVAAFHDIVREKLQRGRPETDSGA